MSPEIFIKISNDKKMRDYLRKNSYWYKLLNRDKTNFKHFYSAYKMNNRSERISKAGNALDTLDTVNNIFKILK